MCSVYLAISVQYRLWAELENKYRIGNFSAHIGLSIRGGIRYFTCLKWSLVPPDFKECYNKILMKIVPNLMKSTTCKQ
jgi:hypothetical protein